VLSSVSPSEARAGDEIQVHGSGFGAVQGSGSVIVSGIVAIIVSWSDTLIRATVPSGATTGAVVVSAGGTTSNPGSFLILWAATVPQNLPICTAASNQQFSQVAPDGAGGAIIVWLDCRNGQIDLYAQRVSNAGVVQWAADGIPICTAPQMQGPPVIIADGSGGAFIAWWDDRSGLGSEIYAQRIDGTGAVQWAANGVAVCSLPDDRGSMQIAPDGVGGFLLTWMDYRSGTSNDVYAQRVNGAGAALWTLNGVPLCTTASNQQDPQIVSDGSGGAIVVWEDIGGPGIGAQRVDASGTVQWAANGIVIAGGSNPRLLSDGSGGAIMVWRDFRSGVVQIYGQRIDSLGVPQWTAGGQAMCTGPGGQDDPHLVSDGSGGAIVVWYGAPSPPGTNIYAQRVNGSGNLLWATDGVGVCTLAADQQTPQIVPDGQGGAVIIWFDLRNVTSWDIYAQRIDGSGAALWTAGGVCVRIGAGSSPLTPLSIAPDGAGGAIIVWDDLRSGTEYDIYAQGLNSAGH
jgi:hypothetical protein